MSITGKDGAWVSATRVTRLDCSKCGTFETSRYPMNEREELDAVYRHLQEKHGGADRG